MKIWHGHSNLSQGKKSGRRKPEAEHIEFHEPDGIIGFIKDIFNDDILRNLILLDKPSFIFTLEERCKYVNQNDSDYQCIWHVILNSDDYGNMKFTHSDDIENIAILGDKKW